VNSIFDSLLGLYAGMYGSSLIALTETPQLFDVARRMLKDHVFDDNASVQELLILVVEETLRVSTSSVESILHHHHDHVQDTLSVLTE